MNKAQEALDALILAGGNKSRAAQSLGVPRTTLLSRLEAAEKQGLTPQVMAPGEEALIAKATFKLQAENTKLRALLREQFQAELTTEHVRQQFLKLAAHSPQPPDWLFKPSRGDGPGVPLVFLSDWHWGELVDIPGINHYSPDVGRRRLKTLFANSIEVATQHINAGDYPGVVLALGGDMVSGDIHDELRETNVMTPLEAVLDLFDHLVAGINEYVRYFGRVFIPCTYGNHGRTTHKVRHKRTAETNYDWLLSCMLEKHYRAQDHKGVKVLVPAAPDTEFRIYDTSYLLTHGDRLGGGGNSIATIERGIKRVKAQYAAKGSLIDTVMMGHFHTLRDPQGGKMNGCGVGYSEFSDSLRFEPEPPTQRMWFTHERRGINLEAPLFLEEPALHEPKEWISWTTK